MRPPLPRLHAVTDERLARRPDLEQVAAALAAGAPDLALHARGRSLTGLAHYQLAVRLRPPPSASARLFVNDRVDIALATAAAGIQLGRGSLTVSDARRVGPAWLIGRSVHSRAEAEAAQGEGADYLLIGPVFATATHPHVASLGVEALHEIAGLGLPVIAIGGITAARIAAVREAGAWGVAVIRALWDATHPGVAAREMWEALER